MSVNEERNTRAQLPQPPKGLPLEINAECVLPDYRSEISKLLWVRPTVLSPQCFISGGKADFSGSLCCRVLYVGPDGGLYTTEMEENYAFSIPVEGVKESESAMELAATVVPETLISRVLGPRKLSVRCRMRARVQPYVEKDMAVQVTGGEGAPLQRLCAAEENGRFAGSAIETVELSDAYSLEKDMDMRLIGAEGTVFLPEVVAGTEQVRCRGEAVLQFLLCKEGGEGAPTACMHRIPFEVSVPLEGATTACYARATGVISQLQVTAEEGQLVSEMQIQLQVMAGENQPVLYTEDLFAPDHTAEYRFAEEELWQLVGMGNRNFSVTGDATLAELHLPETATVCVAVADAEYKGKECEGGRTRLMGEAVCHMVYLAEGEYGVADMRIPFQTLLDGVADEASVSFTVPLCRARTERGRVLAELEIVMAAEGMQKKKVRMLREVRLQAVPHTPRHDMVVCYPAPAETLWSVSKRYGVLPDELAAANAISPEAPNTAESLQGVRYLLLMPE